MKGWVITMISAPTTGKTALQFGVISGVSVNVLLIGLTATGLSQFIPTLIYILAIPALAFFLAGLFAARQTGKVSTGTLAGLLSGVIMIIILMVTLVSIVLTLGHAILAQYTMKNSQENVWIGFVVLTILFSCIMAGIGSGFGALGGLIGKKMSLPANQLSMPYPPASLPMRPYQEVSYQISPPPPPAQQHVYRLLPIWRVFYAVVFPLINVIAGLSLILNSLNSFGNGAFSLFMICFVILAVGYNTYYGIRMSMARLVTSPAGVMYYGVGFRIYAPWHQITGIDTVRKRWIRLTGLTFRTPVIQTFNTNQAIGEQVPVLEISRWRRPFYWQYMKLIPLTWFGGNLQNSALGSDIRWSAPHLLQGIPSAS